MISKCYTYDQISEHFGITKSALTHRVQKLKLKGRTLGKDSTVYFSVWQVKKMVQYLPLNCKNHPRKIDIIELYESGQKGRTIAEYLKISVKLTYDCIREYNLTGCIVVESKMSNVFI
jgi:DNA invertase Pin-like site-specific DNA recombinase